MLVEYDVELVLAPFELRPDMPEAGIKLAEQTQAGHSERVEEYLIKAAAREGASMVLPDFLPNTHSAMALAEIGRDAGDPAHKELHAAIFSAYFEAGLDIGDRGVLLDIGKGQGLDPETVEEAWSTGKYDERLSQFRKLGATLGVESTPAVLICNELLIGAQPYQIIKKAVERCLSKQTDIDEAHLDY